MNFIDYNHIIQITVFISESMHFLFSCNFLLWRQTFAWFFFYAIPLGCNISCLKPNIATAQLSTNFLLQWSFYEKIELSINRWTGRLTGNKPFRRQHCINSEHWKTTSRWADIKKQSVNLVNALPPMPKFMSVQCLF